MAKPSLTELATKALSKAHKAPGTRDDRELLVERMERARIARDRATRLRVVGFGALALAAALALFFGLRRGGSAPEAFVPPASSSNDALVVRSGATELKHQGPARDAALHALHRGDAVAAQSESILAAPRGSQLTLGAGSELAVDDIGSTQIYSLPRGRVRADVRKLGPNERFIVRTSDVEVEVRGTSFLVEKRTAGACHPGVETYVEVREGVVVVRHAGNEERVSAGQSWPSRCEEPAPTSSIAPSARPTSSAPTSAPTDGANDLYARASDARKSGDSRGAVVLLDKLLASYPTSPLEETARVERFRALQSFDQKRAVAAARDYLARHPRGFAHAEAEALVAIPP